MSELYYKNSPSTWRTGERLAHAYGFSSLESFAESFMPQALVIDVGAGWSTLGKEVCELRDDVKWINADQVYVDAGYDGYTLRRHQQESPPNLSFKAVNALQLVEHYGEKRFDDVFSYYMLGHITVTGREYGYRAAENILRIAKPAGRVAIGPIKRPVWNSAAVHGRAQTIYRADSHEGLRQQAQRIVRETRFGTPEKLLHLSLERSLSKFKKSGLTEPEG